MTSPTNVENGIMTSIESINNFETPTYEVLVGRDEILFITYFDREGTILERRHIATINSNNAPKLMDLKTNFDKYLRVDKIDDLDNVFLIKVSAHDHGDFTDFYALVFDPKNEKVLYDTGTLLLESRLGSVKYIPTGTLEICFAKGYFEESARKCQIHKF